MNIQDKIRIFRDRWYSRQDVYGKRWTTVRENGTQASGYAPVCANLWKEFCHIRLKDGVRCDSCEHRHWAPVDDKSILKHIKGEEAHLHYVLQTDGTVKFAALDFDLKPGKEDKGYTFADVSKTSKILESWGIPHTIARSTGEGFHLYFFMSEFYPANKFRAIVLELYEQVGFMDYLRHGVKPIPEFFPKQSYAGKDGLGNGIKPPMIEPNFKKGKNCLVDADNRVIGGGLPEDEQIEEQWRYLDQAPRVTTAQLDAIIEKYGIEVHEDSPASKSTSPYGKIYGSSRAQKKWQPPLEGSIEKVLEGCAALRKVKDRVLKGEVLGHDEGFGLYHTCMSTLDGLDWFKKNVRGWGETDSDLKQLEHSLEKNYSPWTCRTMQDKGICLAGTRCFQKKPPREMVDGREVIRDDLPEDQWPEPSPIRYAFGRGEDFLLKLQKEAAEVSKTEDKTLRLEQLRGIVKRVQVFDVSQQKAFKEHCKQIKAANRNELAKIFNEAEKQFESEVKEIIATAYDSVYVDENQYLKDFYGYRFNKEVKGGKQKDIKLCSIDIDILEERIYLEDGVPINTVYRGVCKAKGMEKSFEIDTDTWSDNSEFMRYFTKLMGSAFAPLRMNLEFIKQAAIGFSQKKGTEKTVFLTTQGFSGDAYLMPSVIVDKEGVRPNDTQHVDLSRKEHAGHLDFSILTDSEFQEVMMHLKTDFLKTWPELWTYTGLSHTFLPLICKLLSWKKRPTLFFEGLTGGGKTELTHMLQHFWGDFPSLLNLLSTGRAILEYSYDFKDACLTLDDYKGLDKGQVSAVTQAIQYSYDGTQRGALNKDGTQRRSKPSRAVFIMTGEMFVTNLASTVARCILIETDKQDTRITREKYLAVQKARSQYRGITPRFASWLLNQDSDAVWVRFQDLITKLKDRHPNRQNADRISQNLALNYITWELWVEFNLHSNIVSADEAQEMLRKHEEHMHHIQDSMILRCEDEQDSVAFARVLKQMLFAGDISITDLHGFDTGKNSVGFIPKDGKDIAYIYPDIAYQKVKEHQRNAAPIFGTERSIARQLLEAKIIVAADRGRLRKYVRTDRGREYVWVFDLEKLGLVKGSDQEQQATGTDGLPNNVVNFRPGSEAVMDPDGLF